MEYGKHFAAGALALLIVGCGRPQASPLGGTNVLQNSLPPAAGTGAGTGTETTAASPTPAAVQSAANFSQQTLLSPSFPKMFALLVADLQPSFGLSGVWHTSRDDWHMTIADDGTYVTFLIDGQTGNAEYMVDGVLKWSPDHTILTGSAFQIYSETNPCPNEVSEKWTVKSPSSLDVFAYQIDDGACGGFFGNAISYSMERISP